MTDVYIFPTSIKFKGKLEAGKYLAKYLKNLRKVPF